MQFIGDLNRTNHSHQNKIKEANKQRKKFSKKKMSGNNQSTYKDWYRKKQINKNYFFNINYVNFNSRAFTKIYSWCIDWRMVLTPPPQQIAIFIMIKPFFHLEYVWRLPSSQWVKRKQKDKKISFDIIQTLQKEDIIIKKFMIEVYLVKYYFESNLIKMTLS